MVQDLSHYHKPLGNLFYPPDGEDWQQYRLSEEQVAHFHEYGYVAGIRILDDDQVEVLREQLAAGWSIRPIPATSCSTSSTPTNRPIRPRAVPRLGRLADHARLSRHPLESGLHRARIAVAGRGCAVLARSALLQAGPARRRRRLASGLFVLDPHAADGPPHLLDRPGRRHAGQRLPALHPRQPSLGPVADHRAGGRHGGHPRGAQRRAVAKRSSPWRSN